MVGGLGLRFWFHEILVHISSIEQDVCIADVVVFVSRVNFVEDPP